MNHQHAGLYRPEFEHDSCGIGFVANLKGRKSHKIIENALSMLACMEHRGGTGVDVSSGDGAGLLIQLPHEFFVTETAKMDITLPAFGDYGVGMVFFPKDESKREECREILERNIKKLGLKLLGYRIVPCDNSMIGKAAKDQEPQIEQVFIKNSNCKTQQQFERKLYVLRNYTTHIIQSAVTGIDEDFYVASMSSRTIVYKGQLTTAQVRQYYLDLQDDRTVSALAMFHSRFATNTFPHWRRAQPFRYLSHNGEINTVKGNINWLEARKALFESIKFTSAEMDMLMPIYDRDMSDSANLDMMVELLALSGRPLAHAMMMVMPEAWQSQDDMDVVKRAFYEYHACIMEPWDGPASVSFTDGNLIGATLDRNGLRPSRYLVTDDGMVVMGSETGALVVDQSTVVEKGRLQPGKIFICDLNEGRILTDEEVKTEICTRQDYVRWVDENKIVLEKLPTPDVRVEHPPISNLKKRQRAFGYTDEDLRVILADMVSTKKEPLGSMGTDTPVAVLSDKPQHLSHYFKQLFAQVTNPPIDPIREEMVMSLRTYIGGDLNLLEESAKHCHKLELLQPLLSTEDLMKLRYMDHEHFQARTIATIFQTTGEPGAMEIGLERICRYAEDAVRDGFQILILTDREVNTDHAPIPSVLATAAIHHHLIKTGLRADCDIVGEFGDVRETHHMATVLGYGASAVNPYLAIASLKEMRNEGIIDADLSDDDIFKAYSSAVNSGLLKIFSKMGISTLQSYQGAQIFEALGIRQEVVDKYFTGTVSRIEGIGLDEIAAEALTKHRRGYPADNQIFVEEALDSGGDYAWRHDGERHLFNPTTIRLLQHSTEANDQKQFGKYCRAVDNQSRDMYTLRGLLKFNADRASVPLEEVESNESIFKRFATGAMSFGSISWEAHTTLAMAMNRIGGKSNSGEGGEDPIRFIPLENGDNMISKIKQVASGRFGVTSHYLTNAEELQIKMAQGAKPGEGGQLPGHKVDAWIGRTRGSTPGVGLISPPPHHDIYSIEDLSQLIFDLKNANRDARINVKLVSEAGVGTIASGVCKAYADVVLIAGFDGGTGASPISSIKHAGLPWELGLAETHQTLVQNGLRSRITVQADGQMKTPRDLAIATLLGAEEWGVATAALVVEGCIMMRKCHLNTCPAGIATQDKRLRERYEGKVENVVNFFTMLAEGLREIMAELGFRTINEMVGQSQCLTPRTDVDHWKYQHVDLKPILYKPQKMFETDTLYRSMSQRHLIDDIIDRKMMQDAKAAIESGTPVSLSYEIGNEDRATGAMLSNEISKRTGADGLADDTIKVKFTGSAGQSFAAFTAKGVSFEVEGDANDYFGKGLSGGHLAVYPDKKAPFVPTDNILIGNVAFFGGTSGKAFIYGRAGERFCVRNSGVTAVVEGIGDHGCEYMTGGCAVILGETGRNFAAGMSGGVAYIYDENQNFAEKCNMEMVALEALTPEDDALLQALLTEHVEKTGSSRGESILHDWASSAEKFIKVMPVDFKRIQQYMAEAKATGKYATEVEIAEAAFGMHIAKISAPKPLTKTAAV